MPKLPTQRLTTWEPAKWPEIGRWGGRIQIGMVANTESVYPAGFRRNLHLETFEVWISVKMHSNRESYWLRSGSARLAACVESRFMREYA